MNTLLWHVRQWGRRLGIAGIAGLAALLIGLLIQFTHVAALETDAEKLHARLAQRQVELAAVEKVPVAPQNPLANLPPTGEASQRIGELEQLARAHGLSLPRGQYTVSMPGSAGMQQWRLVLPLEADYPTLHSFLAAALERLPNLALDEIKLKREKIEMDTIQAELRMSLFIEAHP